MNGYLFITVYTDNPGDMRIEAYHSFDNAKERMQRYEKELLNGSDADFRYSVEDDGDDFAYICVDDTKDNVHYEIYMYIISLEEYTRSFKDEVISNN